MVVSKSVLNSHLLKLEWDTPKWYPDGGRCDVVWVLYVAPYRICVESLVRHGGYFNNVGTAWKM